MQGHDLPMAQSQGEAVWVGTQTQSPCLPEVSAPVPPSEYLPGPVTGKDK